MRHLLSAGDLDLAEVTGILDLAEEMQQLQSRPVKKLPAYETIADRLKH